MVSKLSTARSVTTGPDYGRILTSTLSVGNWITPRGKKNSIADCWIGSSNGSIIKLRDMVVTDEKRRHSQRFEIEEIVVRRNKTYMTANVSVNSLDSTEVWLALLKLTTQLRFEESLKAT